jgi:hypothetical protein
MQADQGRDRSTDMIGTRCAAFAQDRWNCVMQDVISLGHYKRMPLVAPCTSAALGTLDIHFWCTDLRPQTVRTLRARLLEAEVESVNAHL